PLVLTACTYHCSPLLPSCLLPLHWWQWQPQTPLQPTPYKPLVLTACTGPCMPACTTLSTTCPPTVSIRYTTTAPPSSPPAPTREAEAEAGV
ncbi:unnamed protein product, partial [Closterium sp. NIES-54]